MRTFEYKLIVDGDMSSDVTSDAQSMDQIMMGSVQAVWSGASAAGTIKLQTSNDAKNWSDYSGSENTVAGPGDYTWRLVSTPDPWIRVVFIVSSGTGTLNVTISGKGV
jgi:hypothetical protein